MRFMYIPHWVANQIRDAGLPMSSVLDVKLILQNFPTSDIHQVVSLNNLFEHYLYHKGFERSTTYENRWMYREEDSIGGYVDQGVEETGVVGSPIRSPRRDDKVNLQTKVPFFFDWLEPRYNEFDCNTTFMVMDKESRLKNEGLYEYNIHRRGNPASVYNLFDTVITSLEGFDDKKHTIYYDIVRLSDDAYGFIPKYVERDMTGDTYVYQSRHDMEKQSFSLLVDSLVRLSYVHNPDIACIAKNEIMRLWLKELPTLPVMQS